MKKKETIYKKVTYEEFLSIFYEDSNIEYAMEAVLIDSTYNSLWGCILKIGETFHYLHFDINIKNLIDSHIHKVESTFVPFNLSRDIKKFFGLEESSIRTALLEIKDDYLVVLVASRVHVFYNDYYLYHIILEEYNLNLINNA